MDLSRQTTWRCLFFKLINQKLIWGDAFPVTNHVVFSHALYCTKHTIKLSSNAYEYRLVIADRFSLGSIFNYVAPYVHQWILITVFLLICWNPHRLCKILKLRFYWCFELNSALLTCQQVTCTEDWSLSCILQFVCVPGAFSGFLRLHLIHGWTKLLVAEPFKCEGIV